MRKVLLYFALKYNGDYRKILQAITDKEHVNVNELENVESKIKCNYITIIDSTYPIELKSISSPPFVLFYYGDISLLNAANKIAVIGKRECSLYGEEMTRKIVKQLKFYKVVTVSGMAKGIDSLAHQISLENKIKTIAVLGSGIAYCYPTNNTELYEKIKTTGLIISEYPGSLTPTPHNFLIRNRIIAGLSKSIVVIEANLKSGTINTVSFGLEFGKDIFAVPTLATANSGCNLLIKQGAKLIETASDIFE